MQSRAITPPSAAPRAVPAARLARLTIIAGALAVFGIALAARLWLLDWPPHIDELYTVLAAEGWRAEGVPRIADGLYARAWLYTAFIARWFDWFGPGIESARVPSALAGSALVPLVFLWTRAVAGSPAAWIAALLAALSPMEIQISQFARFYAFHALLFWLAATAVYMAVEPRRRLGTRLVAAALALALFPLGMHLQPLTLVGLIGLGLWLAGAVIAPWLWNHREHRLLVGGCLVAAVVVGALLLGAAWTAGLLKGLL
jgi:uncharacterized membrane protein